MKQQKDTIKYKTATLKEIFCIYFCWVAITLSKRANTLVIALPRVWNEVSLSLVVLFANS